jgi:NADH:ubiquinone oxidoreductase subunit K
LGQFIKAVSAKKVVIERVSISATLTASPFKIIFWKGKHQNKRKQIPKATIIELEHQEIAVKLRLLIVIY